MGTESSQFNTSFFETNPSFTATSEVVELTRPLAALGLSYFTFDRHYVDGSRIVLTNHAQWITHYWKSGLFKRAIFEQAPSHFNDGHVLWDWLNREPIYSEAALHGIDHGVTLTKVRGHCSDFFHFGTLNKHITNEFIINNMACLSKFASVFEHKMKSFIKNAENEKIIPHASNSIWAATSRAADKTQDAFEDSLLGLLGKREASRIFLGEEFFYGHLTRSEAILLRELVSGVSCSDISRKLNISDDAVNKRIRSIKTKLGGKTLCEIGFVAGRLCANAVYPVLGR